MTDIAPVHAVPPGGRAPDSVWWVKASDGTRLRAARWDADDPIASAVLLSGRTEYLEKMSIPAAALVARGISVVSLDWRGQGLSDRAVTPRMKGHVSDFAEFQQDLVAVLDHPEASLPAGPQLLMGHSMGGAIAAQALQGDLGARFDAAVLSAPMLGINVPVAMRAAGWLTVRIARLLGMLERWPPFGDQSTPYVLTDPSDNCLTSDEDVWRWMVETARKTPDLMIAGPTIGWYGAATSAVKTIARGPSARCPVLAVVGDRESVVSAPAIATGVRHLGGVVETIPDGQHELLIERADIRAAAWSAIDRFLIRAGVPIRSVDA